MKILPILHPLFVHIHIALFTMSFFLMFSWFLRGLSTAIFENRLHHFAHLCTLWGVISLVLSMAAGIRDGIKAPVVGFDTPLGGWLYVKASLASLLLIIYFLFLRYSNQKRTYLQERPDLMVKCLALQVVGYLIVLIITFLGTTLVYNPSLLPIL